MTQLHRILYCSRNLIGDAVEVEIRRILDASRRNNAGDGITGGLFYSDGCFAQVLEGPADAIEATFERIQCDERHGEVTVLQSGPITARDFPEWSMAFAGEGSGTAAADRASAALASRSPAAEGVLELLRSVVTRETEWLGAPAA